MATSSELHVHFVPRVMNAYRQELLAAHGYIRVAHSVQSKNKNHKSEAGTRSIYANYKNKILCKKSLELDNI